MSREDKQKVRAFLVQKYANIGSIGSNEIDALLSELEVRGMAADLKVVDRILRRRFHEVFEGEKNMSTSRVVPPLSSRAAAPAPPPQTPQELEAVMKAYINTGHWAEVAPNSAPPWAFNGDLMFVGSRANLALLKNKLKEMGVQHIRVSDIAEAVLALAQAGVFERVVEQPAPPPPPPPPSPQELAREKAKKLAAQERSLQDRTTSPIRGAKEKAQPLIKPVTNTNVAEAAASEKAAAENAAIREVQRRISTYAAHSHSKTYSHRAELESVLTQALNEGLGVEQIRERVDQAIDRLAGNSSIR